MRPLVALLNPPPARLVAAQKAHLENTPPHLPPQARGGTEGGAVGSKSNRWWIQALLTAAVLLATGADLDAAERLDPSQAPLFRAWFVRIVAEQVRQGPSPRWVHRDCAGLVRFAVAEALRPHGPAWQQASGVSGHLPQELTLAPDQRSLRNSWRQVDKSVGPFVSALALVQENTEFVSKEIQHALPGDLLFFDQGDDQHVMIWMGDHVAYHRGEVAPRDNGMRTVRIAALLDWKDTRWQPRVENPNFVGIFRFFFLSR